MFLMIFILESNLPNQYSKTLPVTFLNHPQDKIKGNMINLQLNWQSKGTETRTLESKSRLGRLSLMTLAV